MYLIESKLLQELSTLQLQPQKLSALISFIERSFPDWSILYNLSIKEGLTGLIFNNLRNFQLTGRIPETACNLFRKNYFDNMFCYLRCEKAILELLNSTTTPMIFMRGITLTNRIYNSAGVRPFSDIDILIRQQDQEIFLGTLKSIGYIPFPMYPNVLEKNGIIIDLHTDTFGSSRIQSRSELISLDEEHLWNSAINMTIGDRNIRILSPEYELLIGGYHVMKHSFLKLIWLLDIATFLKKQPDFNWQYYIELSANYNLNMAGYYVLNYVKRYTGVNIPHSVLSRLRNFNENKIIYRIYKNIITTRKSIPVAELFFVGQFKQLSAKIRFLTESAFPASRVRKQIFPVYKFPVVKILFFPLRILQIFRLIFRIALLLK